MGPTLTVSELVAACRALGVLSAAAPLVVAAVVSRAARRARPVVCVAPPSQEPPAVRAARAAEGAHAGAELVVLGDGECLDKAAAALPTHCLRAEGGMAFLEPLGAGLRGVLRLSRLVGDVPLFAVLVSASGVDSGVLSAPWSGRPPQAHHGLLAAKNRATLAARALVLLTTAGALAGLLAHAYFTYWAFTLPRFPARLLGAVARAEVAQALALSAAWFLLARAGLGAAVAASAALFLRAFPARRAALFAFHLGPFIPRGSSLLDLGAADGLLLERLQAERGIAPRGLDVCPWTLGTVPVEGYDGGATGLPDASVDVTVSVCTLHHCDDPRAVLREVRRVTRGRFLLVDDDYEGPWDRFWTQALHVVLRLETGMPWNLAGFRSAAGWEAELRAAGFEVVERRRVPIPGWTGLIMGCRLFVAEPRAAD